jgi:P27 family predicted phage terminase small subunit
MGRPRKPTQQKILEGAAIRDDRDSLDIAPPLELPHCPVWLSKGAKKHWSMLGPKLVGLGLLTNIDGDAFAVHCDNVDKYAIVSAQLHNSDSWIEKTPNGFIIQSALMQMRTKFQEQLMKSAREFGLTPSGRSGIRVESKQADLFGGHNEFDDFKFDANKSARLS